MHCYWACLSGGFCRRICHQRWQFLLLLITAGQVCWYMYVKILPRSSFICSQVRASACAFFTHIITHSLLYSTCIKPALPALIHSPIVDTWRRRIIASSASTAVVPPRTKKHQTRTKSKRKLRRKSGKSASLGINPSDKPLPESDVGHHVAKQYITGPGSILRDKASRRDRMETQNRIVTEDSSHKEQMQYLRMLDRHPALVLNADYQVSD